MQAFVRDGRVFELLPELPGQPFAARFAPAFLAQCVPVPPELQATIAQGWLYDGVHFTAPPVTAHG